MGHQTDTKVHGAHFFRTSSNGVLRPVVLSFELRDGLFLIDGQDGTSFNLGWVVEIAK